MNSSLQFRYRVYGAELCSDIALSLPLSAGPGEQSTRIARIELRQGSDSLFAQAIAGTPLVARADWYQYANLLDGASYVRWRGLGEFLVAAGGDRIWWGRAPGALFESFQVYLLGQALSFALVKAGFEPLHGTAIVHQGHAIAMLGDSGFGKSTLAAGFIAAGCPLLTDDLLLLQPRGDGGLDAYPGPPRIKLLPDSAGHTLGPAATGVPMNPETNKHVIALDAAQRCESVVPLRVIYVLTETDDDPQRSRPPHRTQALPISGRAAFFALVGNTFNRYLDDSRRLQRQLAQTTRVMRSVPVRRLVHPRAYERLDEVLAAIVADSLDCRRGANGAEQHARLAAGVDA